MEKTKAKKMARRISSFWSRLAKMCIIAIGLILLVVIIAAVLKDAGFAEEVTYDSNHNLVITANRWYYMLAYGGILVIVVLALVKTFNMIWEVENVTSWCYLFNDFGFDAEEIEQKIKEDYRHCATTFVVIRNAFDESRD